MKVWEIVGLVGAAFFGYSLFQKYEAGTNLNVNFQSVDFSGFPNVTLVLSCQNVTNTPLTINSLGGNVTVSGSPLGSVVLSSPVTIPGNQIVNVPFSISVSLLNLPANVLNVINNLNGSIAVTVVGNANVSGIPAPVPINITQNFSV